ncbi:cupin domain-containing protein [Novosphingobium sp.]|uniref:cupin domain-containing protein n=1 Tax=Novosphingobium sp. TaxID=1874826 RepID=UPI002614E4B7|nr:cupin domain-containing protein [Novosphingobium sp.]
MTTLREHTVAAVVDIRAYAAGTAPATDWFAGRAAPAFADDKAVICAFALRGEGQVETLPTDEFVLVLAGTLEIESAGTTIVLGPDESAAIPFGANFIWRASDDMLAVVYAAPTDQPGNTAAPIKIDTNAPLNPSNPPALENLLGEVPTCRGFSDYVSANAEFCAGTWDSTPYHRRQIPYRQVELMLLLAGKVTFTDAHASVTFAAGDVCMFVRGDGCAWLSEEYVKKVFATQRPLA